MGTEMAGVGTYLIGDCVARTVHGLSAGYFLCRGQRAEHAFVTLRGNEGKCLCVHNLVSYLTIHQDSDSGKLFDQNESEHTPGLALARCHE